MQLKDLFFVQYIKELETAIFNLNRFRRCSSQQVNLYYHDKLSFNHILIEIFDGKLHAMLAVLLRTKLII